MCKICGFTYCPSGCPNYEPDYTPDVCPYCEEHIVRDDEVIHTPSGIYHADCFRHELTSFEVLQAFGIKPPEIILHQPFDY